MSNSLQELFNKIKPASPHVIQKAGEFHLQEDGRKVIQCDVCLEGYPEVVSVLFPGKGPGGIAFSYRRHICHNCIKEINMIFEKENEMTDSTELEVNAIPHKEFQKQISDLETRLSLVELQLKTLQERLDKNVNDLSIGAI